MNSIKFLLKSTIVLAFIFSSQFINSQSSSAVKAWNESTNFHRSAILAYNTSVKRLSGEFPDKQGVTELKNINDLYLKALSRYKDAYKIEELQPTPNANFLKECENAISLLEKDQSIIEKKYFDLKLYYDALDHSDKTIQK